MNETSISKNELGLVVKAVTEMHLALEANGKAGTDEHRSLRALEDRLGSISGAKFTLKEAAA